ncbi:LysR family transcriptional regulator [Magnetovibrio sp. PR-2]|uniref:LysR family transcriptional regulator n=1 Tax=Magnetovibrio sp. PR-2 TaxID=3120356 RepID=UPI002FCE5CB5
MSFDPTTLELFVRIAALGAFAKAGREFGLSPTAATQRIKGLESELGVQVFNRTTRAVSLTPDGETFLGHAERILTDIEDARSDLAGGVQNIKGELRVTGPASFGRLYITPAIAEFLETYPDVRVRLDLNDNVVDIVEQGYDVALRIGALASSTLVASKISDNPRVLVAAPSYLEKRGTPTQPQDLTVHNCIVLRDTRSWQLRDPAGDIHDVRIGGTFVTNHGDAITEAAVAGVGIGLKTLRDVRQHLADGDLEEVLRDFVIEPEWNLWAVRPPSEVVPARVRVFIDFLEQKFKVLEA